MSSCNVHRGHLLLIWINLIPTWISNQSRYWLNYNTSVIYVLSISNEFAFRDPFNQHGSTLIPTLISNHIPSKVLGWNYSSIPNFNCYTVEVWELTRNFIPRFIMGIITWINSTIQRLNQAQIAKFMGPTWGPPGSCRPQVRPMLALWTLLSGEPCFIPLHPRSYW